MQTPVPPAPRRDAACASTSAAAEGAAARLPARAPLFPPRDADAETRRRWLATSPWPEVVFAAAV